MTKKRKIIQTITAWWYPCYFKVFYYAPLYDELDFRNIRPITRTKRQLIQASNGKCFCGKGCKPQKIRIIVEKV